MKVIPAILEDNFEAIKTKVYSAKENGIEEVQIDIADGVFVTNKTYCDIELLGKLDIKLEVHLMVADCIRQMNLWKKVHNVTRVIIHLEAMTEHDLGFIKKNREKISIALNPDTPLESAFDLIAHSLIRHILFMGVTPGFSGQTFQEKIVDKMKRFKKVLKNGITCSVDGGINSTSAKLISGYADWVNASSFIWNSDGTVNRINLNWLKSL